MMLIPLVRNEVVAPETKFQGMDIFLNSTDEKALIITNSHGIHNCKIRAPRRS